MFGSQSGSGADVSPKTSLGSVLIVEDDGLIALTLEDTVREFGARSVQVVTNLGLALDSVRQSRPDCAILDILIGDDETYEVADILTERQIPFLFCSAFTAEQVVERHRQRPMLGKPYRDQDLVAWLTSLYNTRQSSPT